MCKLLSALPDGLLSGDGFVLQLELRSLQAQGLPALHLPDASIAEAAPAFLHFGWQRVATGVHRVAAAKEEGHIFRPPTTASVLNKHKQRLPALSLVREAQSRSQESHCQKDVMHQSAIIHHQPARINTRMALTLKSPG